MSAYWDSNYLVSSHLFIPLIESAVGELIRVCGGVILGSIYFSVMDK